MRIIGIAIVSVLAGIGGGLLTYGLTQPSYDEAAEIIVSSSDRTVQGALDFERRRAEDRAALMGVGVGFLACASTAVAVTFLRTIVDYNVRNRPGG